MPWTQYDMDRYATHLFDITQDTNREFIASLDKDYSMSLTGASYLTTSIHDLIAKAKSRVSDAHNKIGEAVDNLGSAASAAEGIATAINAEADELLSGLGQFTNGAPATVAPVAPKTTPLPPAPKLVDSIIPTAPPLPAAVPAATAEPKKNEGSV